MRNFVACGALLQGWIRRLVKYEFVLLLADLLLSGQTEEMHRSSSSFGPEKIK